jgi:hypothetical protein
MLRAPPLRRALFIAVFTFAALASFGAHASAEPTPEAPRAASSGEPPSIAELLSPEGLREYESGRLLYESGDFAGAYLKFLSAYELSRAGGERDPRLLWNAAACERALRHYANAIVLVRRYLESRSPLITEQAAENARAFITAASAMTVALSIEANVPGAVAYVDDVFVGPVPLPDDSRLDLGTHRIFVRKTGHTGHSETVTTSGQAVHVKALLRPIQHRGRLVVNAGKADSIFVDGVFRGHGRFEGELPSGPHDVRVTAAGRKPFEREVVLADDQTRSMDVTLEHAVESGGVPVWAYVAAGVVLSAGAVTGAYFALRSGDGGSADLPSGSMGRVDLPLR